MYGRHGVRGAMYGVGFGFLRRLGKDIGTDHALARRLWATGNHDARILATIVADPGRLDDGLVGSWSADLDNYVLTDAFADLVSRSPRARGLLEAWVDSPDEWVGRAGWRVLSRVALGSPDLPDAYFEPYVEAIEREIHGRKNRVRDAMNGALIAIGLRNRRLEAKALAAAKAIGTVDVDHGETGCTTPDAAAYIRRAKARARRRTSR